MVYIFIIFLIVTVYVYAGYPLVLRLLGARGRAIVKKEIAPAVTLFIPAYNEEKVIREKILNSLALDYPANRLEIVVASDASTDGTAEIVKSFADRGVRLFNSDKRISKNGLINRFIPSCSGEVIVFTDANSMFRPDAIKKLVRNFSDPAVGCVVGHLKYVKDYTTVGKGEGLYFRYESLLKGLESRLGTVVTGNGAIYAITSELFEPVDPDVPNDFAHPILIASKKRKVVYENKALALEKATLSTGEEFKRRVRIVTRSFTAFMRYRRSCNMLSGLWGFCFISHKLMRWFLPFALIGLLMTNIFLTTIFFRATLFLQILFYGFAALGYFFNKRLGKVFAVPFYFTVINLAALLGILKYAFGSRQMTWESAKSTR